MVGTEPDLPDCSEAEEFYAKYEPRGVLGRGLVSVVRRCVERKSGNPYAVKIIDISAASPEAARVQEETRREVEILRTLSGHPGVIFLHDAFESSTLIFLVLELCPNGELFDYLTQVVTLSAKKTRVIMRSLLDVVAYMHSKFIVHRDIKPENILLDERMNIKVSDFGFAVEVKSDNDLIELMGTPTYLSPEVLRCSMYSSQDGYGRPTDLWACGVLMFTLLAGKPPFWHRRQLMMLRLIMEGRYSFSGPEWDDTPSSAKDLITNLLQVDVSERFTAEKALNHAFFADVSAEESRAPCDFNARKKLRAAIIFVRAVHRLRSQIVRRPITSHVLCNAPYSRRAVRRIIDSCAFRVYGHWVKKGDYQNRAALFENSCKPLIPSPTPPITVFN